MVAVVVAQEALVALAQETNTQALAAQEYRIVFLAYQIGMLAVVADQLAGLMGGLVVAVSAVVATADNQLALTEFRASQTQAVVVAVVAQAASQEPMAAVA